MRAVVVYESMFGNTRRIAEAVGRGIGGSGDVIVVAVGQAGPGVLSGADLLVVGGPTHAHGMSRSKTRQMALSMARKPDSGLALEPQAEGVGLREWFASLAPGSARAAAFDTRMAGPAVFTGRASRRIRRELRRHGHTIIATPESFRVDSANVLRPGEEERARAWGAALAAAVAGLAGPSVPGVAAAG